MPTLDLTTPIGKVRLLIPDRGPKWFAFQDDEITEFLSMESGDVRLAAALALEVSATDEAIVKGITETLDLKVDGVKPAELLLKRAELLREQAENSEAFSVIEYGDLTVFNAQEYYHKKGQWAEGLFVL